MRKYTNNSGIPLSMAVFLATDKYDHEENTISATSLMKPIRQLILSDRVPQASAMDDLSRLVASRVGSAIHDGIEDSWVTHYKDSMQALGYPKRLVECVRVNPEPEEVTEDVIPVYLERRSYKEVMGYTVSGKFDFVGDGRVEDFKTTSTFAWTAGKNDDKYALQGSIYRWLNPDIITDDVMAIQFVFTDWQARMAKSDPKYPQNRVATREFKLMSVEETDRYVRNKLTQIDRYWNAEESEIPYCTDEDLWRSETKWKYYKNPNKTTGRSTKNFNNAAEAYGRLAADGNVGTVIEQPGEVKACKYCPAYPVCTQKDQLIAAGDLKV